MAPVISPHIPRSWVVYHSLLCVCGVANVSFVETLPLGLRVTSLLYHILTLTLIAPMFLMYCMGVDWHQNMFLVVDWISAGLPLGQMFALGFSSLLTSLFAKTTRSFLRDWEDYKKNKHVDLNIHLPWIYINRQRLCNLIALAVVGVHVGMGCAIVRVIDPVQLGQKAYPYFGNKTIISKTVSSFHVYASFASNVVVIFMVLLYCNVTHGLCWELFKLQENMSSISTSSSLTVSKLVSSRCHYEVLVALTEQCNSIFCWILGSTLFIQMLWVCSTVYTLITAYSSLLIWMGLFTSSAILWMILAPAITLTHVVGITSAR